MVCICCLDVFKVRRQMVETSFGTECQECGHRYEKPQRKQVMKPSYKDNDPKGWCGNPSRGAALGRNDLRGDILYEGKLYLRRIYLDNGGYDSNGTYFGHGSPLFWYAGDEGNIDGMIRAKNRNDAKSQINQEYPNARFFR
jgi:hypothetical protein